MRASAVVVTIITLFPVLGFIAFFMLAAAFLGALGSIREHGGALAASGTAAWAAAGLAGVLAAASASLHFIQHPHDRLNRWHCRLVVSGLCLGCLAFLGIAIVSPLIFAYALVMFPLLIHALTMLAMVVLRQRNVA